MTRHGYLADRLSTRPFSGQTLDGGWTDIGFCVKSLSNQPSLTCTNFCRLKLVYTKLVFTFYRELRASMKPGLSRIVLMRYVDPWYMVCTGTAVTCKKNFVKCIISLAKRRDPTEHTPAGASASLIGRSCSGQILKNQYNPWSQSFGKKAGALSKKPELRCLLAEAPVLFAEAPARSRSSSLNRCFGNRQVLRYLIRPELRNRPKQKFPASVYLCYFRAIYNKSCV